MTGIAFDSASHRLRGDAGTAMMETAVVAPILMAMLLAIFDYGLLLRDYLNVSAAVSDGTRYGAIVGNVSPDAAKAVDQSIMERVRWDMGSMPVDAIDRVVIFKAGDSKYGTPVFQAGNCATATASIAGKCNVYPGRAAFAAVETSDKSFFTCTTGLEKYPCGWSSSSRQNDATGEVDYIGIYVKLKRKVLLPALGSPAVLEVASINRLEPVAVP